MKVNSDVTRVPHTFRGVLRHIYINKSLIVIKFSSAVKLFVSSRFFSLCYAAAVPLEQYTVGSDHWEVETPDSTSMHQSWAEGETDRRPQ